MILGLSFGAKKSKTDQTTDVNKTETGTQSGTTSQLQAQQGSTTTSGSQSTTGSTSGTTTSAGTTSQQTSGQQTQQTQSQLFSQQILSALEAATQGGLTEAGVVAGPRADALNFDPTSFVASGMQAAEAGVRGDLETNINALFDSVGGTAQGNSNVALLANRLNNDAVASLAGTRANLTAQGQQIERENIGTGLAQQAQAQGFVTQLLEALKGGAASTTGATATTEATSGQQTQNQQTAEQQQQDVQSKQQVDTTQILASILQELVNNTTNTVGTEHTKGTQSQMGGGLSLSL